MACLGTIKPRMVGGGTALRTLRVWLGQRHPWAIPDECSWWALGALRSRKRGQAMPDEAVVRSAVAETR